MKDDGYQRNPYPWTPEMLNDYNRYKEANHQHGHDETAYFKERKQREGYVESTRRLADPPRSANNTRDIWCPRNLTRGDHEYLAPMASTWNGSAAESAVLVSFYSYNLIFVTGIVIYERNLITGTRKGMGVLPADRPIKLKWSVSITPWRNPNDLWRNISDMGKWFPSQVLSLEYRKWRVLIECSGQFMIADPYDNYDLGTGGSYHPGPNKDNPRQREIQEYRWLISLSQKEEVMRIYWARFLSHVSWVPFRLGWSKLFLGLFCLDYFVWGGNQLWSVIVKKPKYCFWTIELFNTALRT